MSSKRIYTAEQVRRLCPNYKGKPESFDPNKNKRRDTASQAASTPTQLENKAKPKTAKTSGPVTKDLVPPRSLASNVNPTPTRDVPLFATDAFCFKTSIQDVERRAKHLLNLTKATDIAEAVYHEAAVHDAESRPSINESELVYYTVALTWMRIASIKSEEDRSATEKELVNQTKDEEFNVPNALNTYLMSIGSVKDGWVTLSKPDLPTLPECEVEGRGGYHATSIDRDNHNLWEEVPTLGVASDVLMAHASTSNNTEVSVKVAKPNGATFTRNLLGFRSAVSKKCQMVQAGLKKFGITDSLFPETIKNTRFLKPYVLDISQRVGNSFSIPSQRVKFSQAKMTGHIVSIIKTKPTGSSFDDYRSGSVTAESPRRVDSTSLHGAIFCGFQLYKENGLGETKNEQSAAWCCLTGIPGKWEVPYDWYANRNENRVMPEGIRDTSIRCSSLNQYSVMSQVIRKLQQVC